MDTTLAFSAPFRSQKARYADDMLREGRFTGIAYLFIDGDLLIGCLIWAYVGTRLQIQLQGALT
jgi:hypothetical protein